jgi:hypothetical protein
MNDPVANFRAARELFMLGLAMKRTQLARDLPGASAEVLEVRLRAWLGEDEPLPVGFRVRPALPPERVPPGPERPEPPSSLVVSEPAALERPELAGQRGQGPSVLAGPP